MNTTKMQAAAQIIMEGALETLARVHNTTVQDVRDGIIAGHVKLNAQFQELSAAGIKTAMQMHAENQISIY